MGARAGATAGATFLQATAESAAAPPRQSFRKPVPDSHSRQPSRSVDSRRRSVAFGRLAETRHRRDAMPQHVRHPGSPAVRAERRDGGTRMPRWSGWCRSSQEQLDQDHTPFGNGTTLQDHFVTQTRCLGASRTDANCWVYSPARGVQHIDARVAEIVLCSHPLCLFPSMSEAVVVGVGWSGA